MKEVVITNDRKSLLKNKIFTFILIAVVLALFINSIIKSCGTLKGDYFTDFTGVISEVKIEENLNQNSTITIEGSTDTYYIQTSEDIQKLNEDGDLVSGKTISGKVVKSTSRDGSVFYGIYKFDLEGTNIYDLTENQIKSAKSSIIFSSVLIAACIGFAVYTVVKIIRTPKEEKYEYVEYMLTKGSILSSSMFKKESQTKKTVNIYSKLSNAAILVCGAGLIILLLANSKLSNIALTISFITLAIIAVASFVLLGLFKPKFYSKHTEIFVKDYLDYLDNGSNCDNIDNNCSFLKAGLKIEADKDGSRPMYFNYHELNLYVTVLYGKGLTPANIFICSDFAEDEIHKDVNDFVIQITHETYLQIMQNNVPIRGLEFVLTHFVDEIRANAAPLKGYKTAIKKYFNEPEYYDLSIFDELSIEEKEEVIPQVIDNEEDCDEDEDTPTQIG